MQAEIHCTHCGAKIEPHVRFCTNCGRPASITGATTEERTSPAIVSPDSRPTGVTIIAILNILGGIVLLFMAIAATAGGAANNQLGSGFLAISAIVTAIGIVSFVVAYGLLKGRPWAWTLTLIVSIIAIVMTIFTVAWLGLFGIINTIFSAIVLIYLYRPHVKAYFGKTKSSSGRSSEAH